MKRFVYSKNICLVLGVVSFINIPFLILSNFVSFGRFYVDFELRFLCALNLILGILFLSSLAITSKSNLRNRFIIISLVILASTTFGGINDFIVRRNQNYELNLIEIVRPLFNIVIPHSIFMFIENYLDWFVFVCGIFIQYMSILGLIIIIKNAKIDISDNLEELSSQKRFQDQHSLRLPDAALWKVRIPGQPSDPISSSSLRELLNSGLISKSTQVEDVGTGYIYIARQIPGLYSSRSFVVTLLLSWFLGIFGVDRFYLGHIGLGIGKLLTLGGFGIWALIDFILIATRNVNDAEGLKLA